jgi:hypothetical protein
MNKKIIIISASILVLMVASIIAYQMLSVRSHINVVESQQLNYFDGVNWLPFPIGTGTTIDLGNADMSAGSSSTFFVQGINNANRPVMYTMSITGGYAALKYAVTCNGVSNYAITDGGNFNEGLTVLVKNEAGQTSAIGITTIVDAGAEVTTGYPLNPITSVERGEVTDNTWITCA